MAFPSQTNDFPLPGWLPDYQRFNRHEQPSSAAPVRMISSHHIQLVCLKLLDNLKTAIASIVGYQYDIHMNITNSPHDVPISLPLNPRWNIHRSNPFDRGVSTVLDHGTLLLDANGPAIDAAAHEAPGAAHRDDPTWTTTNSPRPMWRIHNMMKQWNIQLVVYALVVLQMFIVYTHVEVFEDFARDLAQLMLIKSEKLS